MPGKVAPTWLRSSQSPRRAGRWAGVSERTVRAYVRRRRRQLGGVREVMVPQHHEPGAEALRGFPHRVLPTISPSSRWTSWRPPISTSWSSRVPRTGSARSRSCPAAKPPRLLKKPSAQIRSAVCRQEPLGSRGGRNTHLVRCCHAARPAGLSPTVEARVLAADCHRDAVRRRFKEVGSDKDNRHSLVRRSWRSASHRSCRAIRTLPFDLGAGGDRSLARTR